MNIRKSLYSEQNDEIIDWIKRLMCTNQPALTERLIRALKGLYPTDVVEYLLGVYYLEFGGTYALGGGRYIERKVSFRRAFEARPSRKAAECGNSDGDWRILCQGAETGACFSIL